jgi:hypothetical protein
VQSGIDKQEARFLKNRGGSPSGPDDKEFFNFLMILYKRLDVKLILDRTSLMSAGCKLGIIPKWEPDLNVFNVKLRSSKLLLNMTRASEISKNVQTNDTSSELHNHGEQKI